VAVDDAGKLWVRHGTGAQGHNVLARFDFEKKAPDVTPFVAVPGFDFRGEIVRHGLGVRVHADAETTVWFDDAMRRLQALADERWPGSVNQVSCVRCGQPDMVATVFTYADRDPGQLWVFRQATASWLSLGKVRPQVDPSKMAAVDFQRVRSRDGLPVPVWITSPAGAPAGRALPTVVLVNDNHQQRGGFWRWQGMEQFLASRGYLVLRPEFRGLDGYGAAHANAGRREWGRAINDDIADVLRWAQGKGLASPQACIAGRKFGGYTALMSLARDPKLYRCGIVWSAWADLELFLQGSNWVDDMISDEWRAQWAPLVAVDPKDRTEVRARSPLRQAAQITAPLLLAWGEKDKVAPIAHGQRLREALRENGNEALWVSYADEGHGWELPETKIDFARRVEQFLARHLGPEAAAAPR
jgi:dipeptidyl aminopeptidase/acylaminoacyl peptidase